MQHEHNRWRCARTRLENFVTRSLKKLGMEARTNEEADDTQFPFVAFSAPPSGSTDYAASVRSLHAWCSDLLRDLLQAFLKAADLMPKTL